MIHASIPCGLSILVLAACGQPERPTPTATGPSDTATIEGLVDAPGAELVAKNCVACHGPKQFLQQRGDRETWLGLIRWMQKDHGMWQLSDDDEDRIVTYLARHYAPERRGRRRALSADQLPPNPFAPK